MKRIVLFAAVLVLLASMATSCGNSSTLSNDGSLTLGSTFICDKFEISLAENIKWGKISDESLFTEGSGIIEGTGIKEADVIIIPITVINKSSEEENAENIGGYWCYDPKGFWLDVTASAYFDDPDINDLGTLKPGETKNACIYMLYVGDGVYSIEFSSVPNENYYFSLDSEEYESANTVVKVNVVK